MYFHLVDKSHHHRLMMRLMVGIVVMSVNVGGTSWCKAAMDPICSLWHRYPFDQRANMSENALLVPSMWLMKNLNFDSCMTYQNALNNSWLGELGRELKVQTWNEIFCDQRLRASAPPHIWRCPSYQMSVLYHKLFSHCFSKSFERLRAFLQKLVTVCDVFFHRFFASSSLNCGTIAARNSPPVQPARIHSHRV